jgi:peroxiredoxin
MKYVALLITAIFFFQGDAVAQKRKKKPSGYKIGSTATDFRLKNVDGKMISLKDYGDAKGFVICFTCNHCPFSIANESRLISLDQRYKQKGYPVIAINPNDPKVNVDDSFDKMIVRAEERGFTFPYLFDEGQKIFPQYGATKTPHIYLLQKTKRGLKVKYMGAIDDSSRDEEEVSERYLENAINALLEGKEIKIKETKAIGCSIKVAKK